MNNALSLSIYRYHPEQDDKPHMENYTVEAGAFEGQMLLDAIIYLKENIDPSLGFRRSCREGVCGSDGMNINGKNGLACITKLSEVGNKVTLRPLPGLPVIRDLIVDMSVFYKQYEKVEPYLQNETPVADNAERLQSPEDRAKLDGLYECILCACCSTACPSYWWNPDKFLGPAALLQAARFIKDSRDTQKEARLEKLVDPYSVYRCKTIMNCGSVCPKGLNPTGAIGDIRHELLKATG
jgi:succinate dehydrogenase / fumarate reductase iron-sulfur subunit